MEEKGRAITKYVRVPPQKARLVAGLIRRLPVGEALAQLNFNHMKASLPLKKTLVSAIANAGMHSANQEGLFVMEVRVDEGPRFKRIVSKAKGQRGPILKRTSHFTVVVGKQEERG